MVDQGPSACPAAVSIFWQWCLQATCVLEQPASPHPAVGMWLPAREVSESGWNRRPLPWDSYFWAYLNLQPLKDTTGKELTREDTPVGENRAVR